MTAPATPKELRSTLRQGRKTQVKIVDNMLNRLLNGKIENFRLVMSSEMLPLVQALHKYKESLEHPAFCHNPCALHQNLLITWTGFGLASIPSGCYLCEQEEAKAEEAQAKAAVSPTPPNMTLD